MNIKKMLPVLPIVAMLSACGSTGDVADKIPLDNDPRIGDKVSQVCFVRNVRSWENVDNDRNALIIKMDNKKAYKVKVVGACDPELELMSIYLHIVPRGKSSCFQRGDKVMTDSDMSKGYGGGCTILSINKWDPEAAFQDTSSGDTNTDKS